jgi:hypothetical protein
VTTTSPTPAASTTLPSTTPATTPISIAPTSTTPSLPAGEQVAFSLPPHFGAVGVDMPVVVSADVDAVGITVVDSTSAVLVEMSRETQQFWTATIPGSAITSGPLELTARVQMADDSEINSSQITVPILPNNGMQLALRQVQATTTVIYDRPWSDAPGELNWIAPVDLGVSTSPAAIASVSDHEVAVLDTASSRITCFDLTGASTCSVPLPVDASGDLVSLGDGTLIATDLRRKTGQREFTVLRIDPRAGSTETIYHEYPMSVPGYPGIAENLQFTWDHASRTAWVGLPEQGTQTGVPDPTLYPYTDALHLDATVTRGPTIQRHALGATIQPGSIGIIDGDVWVLLHQEATTFYSVAAIETSPSGVIWMVIDSGSSNASTSHELVRWRPGETTADTFPFELRQAEFSTRLLTVLDDHSVAFLDTNIGGRIREFTLP